MKLAHRPMRLAQLFPLEASVVIGVILFALAAIIPQTNLILTKARLVEVFGLVATARVDIMERMALTGEGVSDQALAINLREGADTQENIEDYIGQKQSAISVSKQSESESPEKKIGQATIDQQSLDRLGKFEVRPVNNSLLVTGFLGKGQRPFFLTFNPSMHASGGSGNMLWLCGHQKPLPGWSTPLERSGTDLPPAFIFFVCR